MKITIERLRQIITEEVLKEELAPEIAAPAIAAMLQGMEAEMTSEVFGAAFDELYGEGALEGEAERQAGMEEPEEEEFPTDYQAGGAYGDRPRMGFEEGLEEIIKEEISKALKESKYIEHIFDGLTDEEAQLVVRAAKAKFFGDVNDFLGNPVGHLYDELPEHMQKAADELIAYNTQSFGPPAGGGLGGPGGKARHPSAEERQAAHIATGFSLAEDMATRDDIGTLRQQIGDMSYEIERMLVALMKAGYSMEDIMQMASELKRMDPHPADVQVAEEKQYKKSFYKAKDDRADHLIDKGVDKDMAYGIADKQMAKAGKKKKKE